MQAVAEYQSIFDIQLFFCLNVTQAVSEEADAKLGPTSILLAVQ